VRLPENLREQLKTPLGKLLLNKDAVKEKILLEIPENSYIITVGDATTEKMLAIDIVPSLQIIDRQEKRTKRHAPNAGGIKTALSCDNPAGEITQESIEKIKMAYKSATPVRITVNGEEDLLVIPVCIYAPENAVVMYGQPNEGLVIVQITEEIRNKVQVLLNSMN
jgi:GTP-dependent dephospho-CoA kinase